MVMGVHVISRFFATALFSLNIEIAEFVNILSKLFIYIKQVIISHLISVYIRMTGYVKK